MRYIFSVVEHISADKNIEKLLANASFVHGSTYSNDLSDALTVMHADLVEDDVTPFDGLRFDTCANTSVIYEAQYNYYWKEYSLRPTISSSANLQITGIGGIRKPIGIVMIQIPFSGLDLIVEVDLLILKDDVPTLMSMPDIVLNGLDISVQGNYVSHGKLRHKLTTENHFLVHRWSKRDVVYSCYTEGELLKSHRTFGHPSVLAMEGLLKRADDDCFINWETRRAIDSIHKSSTICNGQGTPPRWYKLTICSDDLWYNISDQIDTMFIDGRPLLHMVYEATHLTAASSLRNQSTAEIWRTLRRLWSLTYVGPPDYLVVDQGSAYVSAEMRGNLEADGVKLREAPVESPGSIGLIERYHAPLRSDFICIRQNMGAEVSDTDCLNMAVFPVNATVGPEGLCPMLLVFGTLSRPPENNAGRITDTPECDDPKGDGICG